MSLIERLLIAANKEANELAELLQEAADELERLTAELSQANLNHSICKGAYAQVVSQCDALKADAERYRWLLAQDQPVWRTLEYETSDWINAAIDSAIQGAKK